MWTLFLFTSYGPAIIEHWPNRAGCEEAGKYTGLRYECIFNPDQAPRMAEVLKIKSS
jgi:hypothetical protein